MTEIERSTLLRIFLRVLSVGFLVAFVPWITLIILSAPILAPGSPLAPLLRFKPYNPHYESMMAAIYIPWAVMLWRASHDPARHALFVDFTLWANAAHAAVMLIATPMQKGLLMTAVEGAPLVAIALVLWWLRPRGPGNSAVLGLADEDAALVASEIAPPGQGGLETRARAMQPNLHVVQ